MRRVPRADELCFVASARYPARMSTRGRNVERQTMNSHSPMIRRHRPACRKCALDEPRALSPTSGARAEWSRRAPAPRKRFCVRGVSLRADCAALVARCAFSSARRSQRLLWRCEALCTHPCSFGMTSLERVRMATSEHAVVRLVVCFVGGARHFVVVLTLDRSGLNPYVTSP